MFFFIASITALSVAGAAVFYARQSRKAYEARLEQLVREVREAGMLLRKRGEIASEVAHEIKNPITAILCSAEALDLLIGESLDPAHRKSLRYIREYGDYLLRLVSDFLDLNMLEAKAKEAHPKQVDVYAAVESVIGLLDSSASKKHIRIVHQMSSDELQVWVDPKHLRQILFNLIHNALKFSPEGSEVRIQCGDMFPEKRVKISIKDNGPGMEAGKIEHIFDPYWRERGKAETGHGLGLAVAKSLADLAGGEIHVLSQLGVGTCFDLCLPGCEEQKYDAVDDQDLARAAASKPLLGCKILVVDPDVGARDSMSALIEAWGAMVDQVADASDAVEALALSEYHTLMFDAGCESGAIQEIIHKAKEADTNRAHFIMVSRKPVKAETRRAMGADQVVEKPISGKRLLDSLMHAMRGVLPN